MSVNGKGLYYYEYLYIGTALKVNRLMLVFLFNDFSIQSISYVNKKELFNCLEDNHIKMLSEVKSKTLINLLISENKIERQLFYNLYNSI